MIHTEMSSISTSPGHFDSDSDAGLHAPPREAAALQCALLPDGLVFAMVKTAHLYLYRDFDYGYDQRVLMPGTWA